MKRLFTILSVFALTACITPSLMAERFSRDLTIDIPEVAAPEPLTVGFKKIADAAQYAHADWSQAIGIARGISLSEAFKIANANPAITYFFYTKGGQMVLGTNEGEGTYRLFRHGDTVFFSGTPWWGSAPGLADGYIKLPTE